MRYLYFSLLLCLSLFADLDVPNWNHENATQQESLFLHRIADFWQEEEHEIAKSQIEEFLASFPNSPYADPLRICLAELQIKEAQYTLALKTYSEISSPEYAEKIFLNRMQCLYSLGWFATLADTCEARLETVSDPDERLQTTYFLAIALYNQCLATSDEKLLTTLAQRAKPFFETLLESDLSLEVSEAFAHLCHRLKQYEKAAAIYLNLAELDPASAEEMKFRAATALSQYDKEPALKLFEEIAKATTNECDEELQAEGLNPKEARSGIAKEASYQRLVLLFETDCHEKIINEKDLIFSAIPDHRKEKTLFIFGKSLLSLQRYQEAIELLTTLSEPLSEAALICLLEASYQTNNLKLLDEALNNLSSLNAESPFVLQGRLFRSLLLKQEGKNDEALKELDLLAAIAIECPEKERAAFESIDLELQRHSWESCRTKACKFLSDYPNHQLASSVWKFLAASSERLSAENEGNEFLKKQYIADLQALLRQRELFSSAECSNWQFFLAKAFYDLGALEDAFSNLQELLSHESFSQEANAYLLLAFCHKNLFNDEPAFCLYAERALEKQTTLLDLHDLRLSLFNAYISRSEKDPELLEKAAEHLFCVFEANTENQNSLGKDNLNISEETILWLGEWHLAQFEKTQRMLFAERAERVLQFFNGTTYETPLYKLGMLYSQTHKTDQQIAVMEQLTALYRENPSNSWKWKKEADLLLAEGYAASGREEEALAIFDRMIRDGSAIRSKTIAKACLARAHIKINRFHAEKKEEQTNEALRIQIASELKNLILQRNLHNEPIYLEAALEYVDLLSTGTEKRLFLLEKMQSDFERGNDLFAQDYAQARLELKEQNRIYEGYMQLFRAEILHLRAILGEQTASSEAKDLLMQIQTENAHPLLIRRASLLLQNMDIKQPDAAISE